MSKSRKFHVLFALLLLTVVGAGVAYAAAVPYAIRVITRNAENDGDVHTLISPTDGSVGLVGVKGTPNVPQYFALGTGLSESSGVLSVGPISLSSGVTGTLPVANGGTGSTTLAGAAAAILPAQSGQSGKFLRTDGTSASWENAPTSSGTVTSVGLSSTDLSVSGSPVTSSGSITANLTATGISAGTYSGLTVDAKGRATAGTSRSQASATRSLNGCFQVSSARDALVNYSVDISTSATLLGGQTGTVFLETFTDSGCTSGTQEVARFVNGNSVSLAIAITVTQNLTGTLTGYVPAGRYLRLRTENTTGSPSFTYRSGQEVQL